MRLIVLAVLLAIACRYYFGRWPWDYLRGPDRTTPELTRARNLLGVGPGADRGTIIEAHRGLVARVHPDRGGTASQVHEANAARDLLLARLPEKDPSL